MSLYLFNIESKQKTELKTIISYNDPTITVLNLKTIIFNELSIPIDKLNMFTSFGEPLNDWRSLSYYKISNNCLYYKIDENLIKIDISIQKTTLDNTKESSHLNFILGQSVSVLYLKYLISEKVDIKPEEQTLSNVSKILNDQDQIFDYSLGFSSNRLYQTSLEDLGSCLTDSSSCSRIISLRLTRKLTTDSRHTNSSNNTINLKLDFTFNHLKEIMKIGWNKEAPDHREVSDGLCLICYCSNKNCKINNQMFISNYGNWL